MTTPDPRIPRELEEKHHECTDAAGTEPDGLVAEDVVAGADRNELTEQELATGLLRFGLADEALTVAVLVAKASRK